MPRGISTLAVFSLDNPLSTYPVTVTAVCSGVAFFAIFNVRVVLPDELGFGENVPSTPGGVEASNCTGLLAGSGLLVQVTGIVTDDLVARRGRDCGRIGAKPEARFRRRATAGST